MNNGKKYLAVAVGILGLLLVIIMIIQGMASRRNTPSSVYPSPTLDPRSSSSRSGQNSSYIPGSGQYESPADANLPTGEGAESKKEMEELQTMLPIETEDYSVEYAPNIDRIVMTRKNPEADQIFNDWLIENGYPYVVNNPDAVIYSDKSMEEVQTPYSSPAPEKRMQQIYDVIDILFNQPTLMPTKLPNQARSSSSSSSTSRSSSSSSSRTPKEYGGYVYYSQCHGPYDNYPLAAGCTVCDAGCGPTTVAMILSSFVDTKYDPPEVVDIYKSIGGAACGTGMGYAKSVLSSHGIKTSDYIIPYTGQEHGIDEVRDDLREYIDNGWTIFVLAWYKPNQGGGHYFWLTDIDEKGNALAFDPYYGMDQTPPINENVRYPMPKYAAAFGVKPN